MANLTRYDVGRIDCDGDWTSGVGREKTNGEWVKFEDVKEFPKTPTNSDYTAALRAAIGDFFGMFSNKCLHEANMDRLASRLNSVVKAQQNCA